MVTRAHTFGDYPHDSWGTVLPRVLLKGTVVFLHFRNLFTHKLNAMDTRPVPASVNLALVNWKGTIALN